jgi:hypothetical protein
MHLDLVSATFGSDGVSQSDGGSSTEANKRTYWFKSIPKDAEYGNFVFAVQKSKTVECKVKPALP